MKILNEKKLQQTALSYLCDTGFKDFMKFILKNHFYFY